MKFTATIIAILALVLASIWLLIPNEPVPPLNTDSPSPVTEYTPEPDLPQVMKQLKGARAELDQLNSQNQALEVALRDYESRVAERAAVEQRLSALNERVIDLEEEFAAIEQSGSDPDDYETEKLPELQQLFSDYQSAVEALAKAEEAEFRAMQKLDQIKVEAGLD